MANEVLLKEGTQLIFANHANDFVGGATKTSLVKTTNTTDVQIDFRDLADTAGRESDKTDLGITRAERYSVSGAFEFAVAPTTGDVMEFYWAPSPEIVAADGNPMSINGVDAISPSGFSTLAELVAVCQFIGVFVCSNDATGTVQTGYIGTFSPANRHGILIVKNESAQAIHNDTVESHVTFDPIITEVQ